MSPSDFSASLKDRIEKKYGQLGYAIGWRLLYSPLDTLGNAHTAFIGQTPGGDHAPPEHAVFAMRSGSAFAAEPWGERPGENQLQREVLALFDMINQCPENVLAGNLVPFRSPSWEELPAKRLARDFGKAIWKDILEYTKPRLVVGMGRIAASALKEILRVQITLKEPLNWGAIAGERGTFHGGTFVGLPILSRFPIATRAKSQQALQNLLGDHYRPRGKANRN